ncbi:MAG: hypothetical protein ACR2JM_14220, partial [Mycobacterium sp.]
GYMGGYRQDSRVHVIEGKPWKQALICALNPDAPYEPWHGIDEADRGQFTVVVLDTDPPTLLCAFTAKAVEDPRHTIAGEVSRGYGLAKLTRLLHPVSEVETGIGAGLNHGRTLEYLEVGKLLAELTRYTRIPQCAPLDRTGDSALAIGSILMKAQGRCTVCYAAVVISTEEELDRLVHTASEAETSDGVDWPALLCDGCESAMRDGGFSNVVDFVYSGRPACPVCTARRAQAISYGKMGYEASLNSPPWQAGGGCVVDPSSPQWACRECGYCWGEVQRFRL